MQAQMSMKMREVRPGFFELVGLREMPHPVNVLPQIDGIFPNAAEEEAASVCTSLSAQSNCWVGFTEQRYREVLRRRYPHHPYKFDAVMQGMQGLLDKGMLKIHRRFTWWPAIWFNKLYPEVICPTELFLNYVQGKQISSED